MTLSYSNAAQRAALDAKLALLNAGAGPTPTCRVYTAPIPTRVDDGVGAATLLAELAMDGTSAFQASTDDAANNRALATANAIQNDAAANATGQAAFCLFFDKDDNPVLQGSAGDVGTEFLVLNNANLQQNAIVGVTLCQVYEAESAADV